mgnify:FL=1
MNLTKEYLKLKFKEYNQIYFEGKLRMCNFSIYKTSTELGRFTYGYSNNRSRIWIAQNPLNIDLKEWTEELLKQTLVHEMIHYYVSDILKVNTIFSPHGYHFRKVCRQIWKKHHYKVNSGTCCKRLFTIKQKPSPNFRERLELLYLYPINYILTWIF